MQSCDILFMKYQPLGETNSTFTNMFRKA